MTSSTNEILEQGIEQVARLASRITTLSEQETAFQGVAEGLRSLHKTLNGIGSELEKLSCQRETMKWRIVWGCLGLLGVLQIVTLVVVLMKA